MKSFVNLTFTLLIWNSTLFASGDALWKSANEAYSNGNYENAALLYDSLLSEGYQQADLYYNLANSYFKLGKTGKCILYYEKALKLNPDDEDITFNLQLANLRVLSKIEGTENITPYKIIEQGVRKISLKATTLITIVLIWISLIFGSIYIFGSTLTLKKYGFISMILFLILFGIGLTITSLKYQSIYSNTEAIMMATNTYVKSAPDENSTDLFILHEGVKLSVLDEVKNWRKIRIPDGKVGWIEASKLEKI